MNVLPDCYECVNYFLKLEPYPMALGIFLSSYVTVISCCVTVCSYVLSRVKDLGSSLVE